MEQFPIWTTLFTCVAVQPWRPSCASRTRSTWAMLLSRLNLKCIMVSAGRSLERSFRSKVRHRSSTPSFWKLLFPLDWKEGQIYELLLTNRTFSRHILLPCSTEAKTHHWTNDLCFMLMSCRNWRPYRWRTVVRLRDGPTSAGFIDKTVSLFVPCT